MDDLSLEKKLSEDYCNMNNRFHVSESCKNRLEHLSVNSRPTKVRTRILITQIASILMLLILIPTTTYAAVIVSNALSEKVKEADLSEDQIEKLYNQLQEAGFSESDIENFISLHRNESGQIYGINALGAGLIAVISVEGLNGYVYSSDLYFEPDFMTPEEVIEWQESHSKGRMIPVYENDGITVIGTFKIG